MALKNKPLNGIDLFRAQPVGFFLLIYLTLQYRYSSSNSLPPIICEEFHALFLSYSVLTQFCGMKVIIVYA